MSDRQRDWGNSGTRRRGRESYDPAAMRWVSALAAVAGLWIAGSPFVYASTAAATWNNVAVGLAVVVLAGASALHPANHAVSNVATATVLALLGIWTVVAPLVVAFENPSLAWSTAGAGGLVALVSTVHAYAIRSARSRSTTQGP